VSIPARVLSAWDAEQATIEPISIGLINRTYRVDRIDGSPIIVQCLHPIFASEVNLDIDDVTRHLARKGLVTPRLVPTRSGTLWTSEGGEVWRALTFLEGHVHTEVRSPSLAYHAGLIVGQFHRAVSDLEHTFHFVRAGVHDTAQHLDRLRAGLTNDGSLAAAARSIGEAVLAHAEKLSPLPATRRRILHQDLKISNILFDQAGEHAIALLDLDTLGHGIVAHEMGDALRSWCNPHGENSEEAAIDIAIFEAALRGWGETMRGDLDPDEVSSLVLGTETIALELASRFALDAILDTYFGWDKDRYPSRAAHNRARATSQLSLARSVRKKRNELERIVKATLGP
jgi:Ser/Thr protein kinase RdoA (MazF antagonist)